MTTVLFVTWDGGGNLPPATGIAAELRARGHRTRFLGHESQRATIEAEGFEFEAFRHAKPWSVVDRRTGPAVPLAFVRVFSDRGMGRDLVESLERDPAERVVIDGLLVGAMDGAARAGIPYTILVHTLRDVMTRSLFGGPLAFLMRLRGLDPARRYREAEGEIVTALDLIDPAASAQESVGHPVRYTGPMLPRVEEAGAAARPPVVLVSLSTTYIDGQREVIQRVLDALGGLDVRVIVTTGPAVDPTELRAPDNAEVHRVVPHRDLMPGTSLVIGHGGHGTTMLALAHGLPLLVIPMNPTFDQPVIGRLLAARGAAVTVPRSADIARIRTAVERLLTEPSFRSTARELGAAIRSRNAAELGADAVLAGRTVPAA
jgi:UDP:flavonoid glycosyltransferase YjiC (YdhE family)